jgi:hypothetical protein
MIVSIARRAAAASPVFAASVRPDATGEAVHGARVDARFALGLELIREGYLVHTGMSRAFAPADTEAAVLLGDHLYADGLVEICRTGDLDAVAVLADLIATVSVEADDGAWERAVVALR